MAAQDKTTRKSDLDSTTLSWRFGGLSKTEIRTIKKWLNTQRNKNESISQLVLHMIHRFGNRDILEFDVQKALFLDHDPKGDQIDQSTQEHAVGEHQEVLKDDTQKLFAGETPPLDAGTTTTHDTHVDVYVENAEPNESQTDTKATLPELQKDNTEDLQENAQETVTTLSDVEQDKVTQLEPTEVIETPTAKVSPLDIPFGAENIKDTIETNEARQKLMGTLGKFK